MISESALGRQNVGLGVLEEEAELTEETLKLPGAVPDDSDELLAPVLELGGGGSVPAASAFKQPRRRPRIEEVPGPAGSSAS